jgi:G:T/U-mismatch repair DNA glycosylase
VWAVCLTKISARYWHAQKERNMRSFHFFGKKQTSPSNKPWKTFSTRMYLDRTLKKIASEHLLHYHLFHIRAARFF